MEAPKQPDHVLTGVIAALIILVFVLDLLTPSGIAIWALYVIPLGLTTWSSIRSLLPITAGVCSVFVILGYFYSPPGVKIFENIPNCFSSDAVLGWTRTTL